MNGEKSALRAKPVRLDPLDQDYQARLEATDQLLSALIHGAVKYRHMVKCALLALRTGAEPGPVRASLEPWEKTRKEIKRLVRDL
jgi:hypothetical protein